MADPMRILVISNYFPPLEIGGWEQLTRDVVGSLRERGHQVRVMTSDYRADEIQTPEQHVERVLHLESPDHVRYHPNYILQRRGWEQANQQALARVSQSFRPQIVFVNGMWNLPVSLARAAEELYPDRVVYYMASLWPAEPDAHHAYWSALAKRRWMRPMKRSVASLLNGLWMDGNRSDQLALKHVLCVSEYIRSRLVAETNILCEQTSVVHNGVELDTFLVRKQDAAGEVVRIIYAGRLSHDKGAHTVIEALGLLFRREPDLPFVLTIVGSGPKFYEQGLRNLVDSYQLQDRVEFIGQAPRDNMADILAHHDVLVLPSICEDALARVVQEAMACGLVVIGTTTGGTPEILSDGENGLTFEAENVAMLADKIERVVADQGLRICLAQAARQTVEERFSFERMVDEIEAYFERVLLL